MSQKGFPHIFIKRISLGLSVTISPDNDAFLLQRPNQQIIDGNVSRSSIYIHNGCVYNTEQLLTAQIGEQRFSLPLYSSMQNLYCAVAVKVVQQKISIVSQTFFVLFCFVFAHF